MENICIVGTGGMAREVLACLKDCIKQNPNLYSRNICFLEKDENCSNRFIDGFPIVSQTNFNPQTHSVIIAVGNVSLRKKIAKNLPVETRYATLIHPSAIIADDVNIGMGTVIMAGTIISCNVTLGNHLIIDRLATIGHDCVINDFFHLAPSAVLSGNVIVEDEVFIGTKGAVKEQVHICSKTMIGMGSIVIKDITKPGTYIGNPARKLK